jgi:hypothetical protein
MKRHAIALILQPYKNRLMQATELKESINRFAEQLLALNADYPNFHFNVGLPGYILECINPLLLSKLREMHKRGCLEWLLTGYTEPFLSFFPIPLIEENIRKGIEVFTELTGAAPAGFMPAFSNWEPSYITTLRNLGLTQTVLSSSVLPLESRNSCGYWTAEQMGDSIALFPSHVLHHYSAPADIIDWLEKLISRDEKTNGNERLVVMHYLLPLESAGGIDPYRWLKFAVAEIDKRILLYQPLLLNEARALQPPMGLQHLPACLPLHDTQEQGEPNFFLNRLHSFDQIGIIQRKMMELCDRVATIKEQRLAERLKHRLYFLQDINRFLPMKGAGFTSLSDRLWTFGQLILVEKEVRGHEKPEGGRIRISDFLRNGNKSIIMSNDSLKVYCDYKNGGHIFELDYRDRALNLCAAFNPTPHSPPDILSPGKSFTSFIDRIHAVETASADFIAGTVRDLGNFADGAFEYKIKKTASSVKTVLSRQGSFERGDKPLPLNMEKVFGLEKDSGILSFVYQLGNHSLTSMGFTFAIELAFSLPGAVDRQARLICGKTSHANIGWESVLLEQTTKWSLADLSAGIRLQFVTQKPLDVFCLPIMGGEHSPDPSCGVRLVLVSRVSLEQSSTWTIAGNIVCKKLREKRKVADDAL